MEMVFVVPRIRLIPTAGAVPRRGIAPGGRFFPQFIQYPDHVTSVSACANFAVMLNAICGREYLLTTDAALLQHVEHMPRIPLFGKSDFGQCGTPVYHAEPTRRKPQVGVLAMGLAPVCGDPDGLFVLLAINVFQPIPAQY